MKQKDYMTLVVIVIVATIFSIVLAGKIFGGSAQKHDLKAPEVQAISGSFPDVKNDTTYNSVFNANSLNPTQLIQIGTNQNNSTFNASQ
jgi:hypothetical protein